MIKIHPQPDEKLRYWKQKLCVEVEATGKETIVTCDVVPNLDYVLRDRCTKSHDLFFVVRIIVVERKKKIAFLELPHTSVGCIHIQNATAVVNGLEQFTEDAWWDLRLKHTQIWEKPEPAVIVLDKS